MKIINDPIKATSGRGASSPVIRSQKSTESANTPADLAPTEAEEATGGRGNFFSRYKMPLIIGGVALAALFIFMNRRKTK